jgi:uncharacterized protein DUF4388
MALSFDLDPHGRLVPGSEEARRALADRAGRFTLLPSASDLLVARRTPAGGGASARPRCVVAGDLAAFPIADFVAFMHQSRLSGVLTVASGGAERTVAFEDGEVRSATSTAPGERIGEVAVRLGYATEAQIAKATQAGRPLGKALVDLGFVAEKDLWRCFHEQVTAVFHAILLSPAGTFFLVDEDQGDRPGAPLSVSTQTLLMDGVRRIDEMSLFQARIPGAQAYLRRREPRRAVTLTPIETALLELVDGRRNVAAIAMAAHLNEFDATKILYHLAEAGYVEAVAAPAASVDPAGRLGAIASGMNELLRLVLASVPQAGRTAFLAAARSFLADPAGPFAAVWGRVVPQPDGAVNEAAVLANLEAVPPDAVAGLGTRGEPPALLLHALRELLFFYLFLAGERIGADEDERLSGEVKMKLARLEALA